MKIITIVLLLAILSGCSQNGTKQVEKIKRIGIHTFSTASTGMNQVNWYYIRNRNSHGEEGYYLESNTNLENFSDANFVYYDSKPEKFKESYPLKERIILVNAEDLPANIRQSTADLESITVRE